MTKKVLMIVLITLIIATNLVIYNTKGASRTEAAPSEIVETDIDFNDNNEAENVETDNTDNGDSLEKAGERLYEKYADVFND